MLQAHRMYITIIYIYYLSIDTFETLKIWEFCSNSNYCDHMEYVTKITSRKLSFTRKVVAI